MSLVTVAPDVRLDIDSEGLATLTLDQQNSRVNVLNPQLCQQLDEHITTLAATSGYKAVLVVSAKPRQFVAGADISQIKQIHGLEEARVLCRQVQQIFQNLANLKVPKIAVISGPCLGGGLELALACDYRISTDDSSTQIGLPEVQLGVIPGAGGTQRLPRLLGLSNALELILAGRRLRPDRALKQGLVDEVVPASLLLARARAAALELASKTGRAQERLGKRTRGAPSKMIERMAASSFLPAQIRKDLQKKTKGHYPAPFKALEAVLASTRLSLEDGLALEAELFGECATSTVCKALIHLFEITTANKAHSERQAKTLEKPLSKIGILGGGLMGSGIAAVASQQGVSVRIKDRSNEVLAKTMDYATRIYQKDVDRRRLRPFERDQRLSRIRPTVDYSGFAAVDLVVEAVFEDLAVKHQVLHEIEAACPSSTVFATNTSAIPIAAIANAAARPENVVGMHFFSPVEKMQLVEVIVTPQTSARAEASVVALGRKTNTHVIVVGDGPGFYTTRVLAAYLIQALQLYFEGAHADQIDDAMVELGFPIGPIGLMDEVGLDVAVKVMSVMNESLPERFQGPDNWKSLFSADRLGKKNKRGFYVYSGKAKEPDSELYNQATAGRSSRTIPSMEIQERCLYAFLAECLQCRADGVLRSADDGDLGAVFGLGFPPFLGGPFQFIRQQGLEAVIARLHRLRPHYGPAFDVPAGPLAELVLAGYIPTH